MLKLTALSQVTHQTLYRIDRNEVDTSLDKALKISNALSIGLAAMLIDPNLKVGSLKYSTDLPEWRDSNSGLIARPLLPKDAHTKWLHVWLPVKLIVA